MPEPRSRNRDKAREMCLNSGGSKPLEEIAAEIGVPDGQIRKWKSTDKRDDEFIASARHTESKSPPGLLLVGWLCATKM